MFRKNDDKKKLLNEKEELCEKIYSLNNKIDVIEEEKNENLGIADGLYEELIYNEKIVKNQKKIIEELQSKNNILIEHKQFLEDLFINSKAKWNKNIDNALRINPKTKKPELYKIPKNLKIEKVEEVWPSDDLKWVSFKYDDEKYENKEFKIPWSLAEQLKIVKPLRNLKNQNEIDIQNIENIDDIKNYLELRGIDTNQDYWKESIDFLIWFRGNKFKTADFYKDCKFRNSETARLYINKLIEVGLIKRFKKGLYEVLFDFE